MSLRLRALVADDEPLARARIRRLLEADGHVEVVAECAGGEDAMAAMRALRPDVAFLDIRMPGADGFQVLARAGGDAHVVFVTAHAEHAVRAFEAAATDYLLKPLSPQRLAATLQRLRAARALSREVYPDRVLVHVGARMQLLPVGAIDCVIAQANYAEVHAGEQRYLLRETLAGLESRLDPAMFVRVHRSRIVRIGAVRDIEQLESGQYLLRLHGGQRLGSGRMYRDRLRAVLGLARA